MFSIAIFVLNLLISLLHAGLNVHQKHDLLKVHNDLRSRVAEGLVKGQPSAANMKQLEWNDDAAWKAQRWADKCQWDHDPSHNRRFGHYKWVGQNMAFWHSGNVTEGIQMWFNEVKGFDFDSGRCTLFTCLHYTTLVWANTDQVGCGLADCRRNKYGNMFLVCNYAPGGNIGYDKPYEVGLPCSKCPERFHCRASGLCH